MKYNIRKKPLILFLLFSSLFHLLVLVMPAKLPNLFDFKLNKANKISNFKIHSLRTLGERNSLSKHKSIYIKDFDKFSQKAKHITAKQLAPVFSTPTPTPPQKFVHRGNIEEQLKRPKAIKSLSLNRKSINKLLQGTPNEANSKQFMKALGATDTMVKLEVPQGVKEDELNKRELVFYSFQKRTALNYINSFYKKLNQFELENPHLHFPLTDRKQQMVGRVIYDKNGNIIKINILKWTNIEKLQSFFVEVLKEMTSLPNPPHEILKDEQFAVFYALTVNG